MWSHHKSVLKAAQMFHHLRHVLARVQEILPAESLKLLMVKRKRLQSTLQRSGLMRNV